MSQQIGNVQSVMNRSVEELDVDAALAAAIIFIVAFDYTNVIPYLPELKIKR